MSRLLIGKGKPWVTSYFFYRESFSRIDLSRAVEQANSNYGIVLFRSKGLLTLLAGTVRRMNCTVDAVEQSQLSTPATVSVTGTAVLPVSYDILYDVRYASLVGGRRVRFHFLPFFTVTDSLPVCSSLRLLDAQPK